MSSRAAVDVAVEPLLTDDWTAVRDIYEEGIRDGNATFESSAPAWEEWDASHRPDCRFVARVEGSVLGWVALSPVSGRCVYGGVAEISVFVARDARGRGIGGALLRAVIAASEASGIWTLQAGILPENAASLRLHEAHGFRRVGVRERLGQDAAGAWRDVVLLERRSRVVGE